MRLTGILNLLVWAVTTHAQGLVWSTDRWAEHSEVPGASWAIAFDHVSQVVGYPPSADTATRIFFMTLTTNDVGRTFFTDALNEPGFGGFIASLTDGTNGFIRFQDGSTGAWLRQSEELFLGRSALSPDLAGYDITQIGFRVNNFYDWYDSAEERNFRTLNYSLGFYGAPVPEASTWVLLILGGFSILSFGRWRRPNQALQRTQPSHHSCNRGVSRAGSLSLSR